MLTKITTTLLCGALALFSFSAQADQRSGTIKYKITVNIKSKMETDRGGKIIPICYVNIFHWGFAGLSYNETASKLSVLNASKAVCEFDVPYNWANASPNAPIEQRVSIVFSKDNYASLTSPYVRGLNHRLPDLKVPAQGGTATVTANFDM
jgi:hypothetical protein